MTKFWFLPVLPVLWVIGIVCVCSTSIDSSHPLAPDWDHVEGSGHSGLIVLHPHWIEINQLNLSKIFDKVFKWYEKFSITIILGNVSNICCKPFDLVIYHFIVWFLAVCMRHETLSFLDISNPMSFFLVLEIAFHSSLSSLQAPFQSSPPWGFLSLKENMIYKCVHIKKKT